MKKMIGFSGAVKITNTFPVTKSGNAEIGHLSPCLGKKLSRTSRKNTFAIIPTSHRNIKFTNAYLLRTSSVQMNALTWGHRDNL